MQLFALHFQARKGRSPTRNPLKRAIYQAERFYDPGAINYQVALFQTVNRLGNSYIESLPCFFFKRMKKKTHEGKKSSRKKIKIS